MGASLATGAVNHVTRSAILGGTWVVIIISGVISKVTILITHIRGLITLLITTHGPPSTRAQQLQRNIRALVIRMLCGGDSV